MRIPSFALAVFFAALLCTALLPLFAHGNSPSQGGNSANSNPEWAEAQWLPANASPVRQPLTTLEKRFASRFPGHIARFSDGRHVWIVRVMNQPTRMLHPAADCFRGLGYEVEAPRVHGGAHERNWRCFAATKSGKRLNVCERIFDAKDGNWTDTSSWYWSAQLGMHGGPWWAVTQVEES
jgi:hypothetical protein